MFASSAGQAVAAPACVATRDRRTILRETRRKQKRCCPALARGAETRAFSSPARDRPSSARGDRFTRRVAELNAEGPSARGERTRADSVAEGASSSELPMGPDPNEKDPTDGPADPEESSGGDIAQLLSRADGAVHQAFVSLLGGDLDARVPARRPPPLGSTVTIAGPAPELDWHRATRTDAQRRELIASLATGRFREPCILRGAADEWPAVCDASKAWTLSRLVADHGSFAGEFLFSCLARAIGLTSCFFYFISQAMFESDPPRAARRTEFRRMATRTWRRHTRRSDLASSTRRRGRSRCRCGKPRRGWCATETAKAVSVFGSLTVCPY